ncbi:MAG: hypothetical protein BWY82_02778 [Verrucomicrobia bacterium ADurb.Bin474]|nr:MAG: hypothetical protein BWY82_02778 [Verrucomicrobia bacterium ADurb.Bin474]
MLGDRRLVFHQHDVEWIGKFSAFILDLGYWPQVNHPSHLFNQRFLAERLHNIITDSDLGDLQDGFLTGFSGQHDHWDVLERIIRLQLGEHLNTIHHRHGNVQKDQIRILLACGSETLNTVCTFADFQVEIRKGLFHDHPDGL